MKSMRANLVNISIFGIVMSAWLVFYIFLGEDIQFNTMNDYIGFNIVSLIITVGLMIYFKFSKWITSNLLISISEGILLPILIAGYLGSISITKPINLLSHTRLAVLTQHIIIFTFGIYKTISLIKDKTKIKN